MLSDEDKAAMEYISTCAQLNPKDKHNFMSGAGAMAVRKDRQVTALQSRIEELESDMTWIEDESSAFLTDDIDDPMVRINKRAAEALKGGR